MHKRGQIVKSTAGRDKGEFQVVLAVDGKFLVLCDGKSHSIEKPKRKKSMHTAITNCVLPEEQLLTDRKIRTALRQYQDA